MKKIYLMFLLLFVAMSLFGQFRGFDWGTSKEKIKQLETSELYHVDSGSIMYKDTIADREVFAYYLFPNYRNLEIGMYVFFHGSSVTEEEVQEKYQNMNEMLESKYGDPKIKDTTLNDFYIALLKTWDRVIVEDEVLKEITIWDTDTTHILHYYEYQKSFLDDSWNYVETIYYLMKREKLEEELRDRINDQGNKL